MTDNFNEQSDSIPIESIRWDSSWPGLEEAAERHTLFSYLENRFGIHETLFDEYLLFKKKKSWWLLRHSSFVVPASQFKISIAGLRAFQKINRFVKPSTRMIQVFGHNATRATLDLTHSEFDILETGEPFPMDLEIKDGYVIISYEGHPLGLGLFINGSVLPQIPRKELRFFR
jgi:NOL1/NOP2/fmu family ribosome biogenesis protein